MRSNARHAEGVHGDIQSRELSSLFTLHQMTTHGKTHQEWGLQLQAAYAISRPEEEVRFEPHKLDCNRRLLWSLSLLPIAAANSK
jgi:hypothetical protein